MGGRGASSGRTKTPAACREKNIGDNEKGRLKMKKTCIYEDDSGYLSAVSFEDERVLCAAGLISPDGTSDQWFAWLEAWEWLPDCNPDWQCDPDWRAKEMPKLAAEIREKNRFVAEAWFDWVDPIDVDDEKLIEMLVGRASKILHPADLIDVLMAGETVNGNETDVQKASQVYKTYFSKHMFVVKCADEKYLVLIRSEAGVLKSPFVCGIDVKQPVGYLLFSSIASK